MAITNLMDLMYHIWQYIQLKLKTALLWPLDNDDNNFCFYSWSSSLLLP